MAVPNYKYTIGGLNHCYKQGVELFGERKLKENNCMLCCSTAGHESRRQPQHHRQLYSVSVAKFIRHDDHVTKRLSPWKRQPRCDSIIFAHRALVSQSEMGSSHRSTCVDVMCCACRACTLLKHNWNVCCLLSFLLNVYYTNRCCDVI